MNLSIYEIMDYKEKDTWWSGKNEPKTNPNEPNSNPISAHKMPKRTQFKPNLSRRSLWRSRIRGKKMLPRMTNNPRRKSLGHYADWRFFAVDHGPNLSCFVGLLFAQGLIFSEKNSNCGKSPIKPHPVFVDLYILRKPLYFCQGQGIISADFRLKIENNRYSKEV